MQKILLEYQVNPATWFYLSLLLIIAVYFRFNRLWSLRNLDLILLLAISPLILWVKRSDSPRPVAETAEVVVFDQESALEPYRSDQEQLGPAAPLKVLESSETQPDSVGSVKSNGSVAETPGSSRVAYVWIFLLTGVFLLRTVFDSAFRRRPTHESNLNHQGLLFLCCAALVFLGTEAITRSLPEGTETTLQNAQDVLQRRDRSVTAEATSKPDVSSKTGADLPAVAPGPATPLIVAPVELLFRRLAGPVMAILAHFAVVLGLIFVGRQVFGDVRQGLAMSTLYVLLPCTAYDVSEINHVLPMAFVTWAIVYTQRPIIAGLLMGLAMGTMFFPAFLVPIWAAYYGRRNAPRFLTAVGIVAVLLISTLALTSSSTESFIGKALGTIKYPVLAFEDSSTSAGFWNESEYYSLYRMPVIAGFAVLIVWLTIWPREKTTEQLISHSAAIICATQFWYPQQGGIYILWYLPLLLIVIFRPRNLQFAPQERHIHAQSEVRPSSKAFSGSGLQPTVYKPLYRLSSSTVPSPDSRRNLH